MANSRKINSMTELADANPATTGEQKELPPRDADTGRFTKPSQPNRKSVRELLTESFAEEKRKAQEAERANQEPRKAPPQKAATEEPEAEEEEELPEGEVQAAEEDTSELDEPKGERRVSREASTQAEDDEDEAEERPQASKATAPASWNKAERAVWDSMPPAAQEAVLRREADTAKGVDKLKQEITGLKDQNRDIDEAIAPYRQMIFSMGRKPGEAIRGLFDWQMALAGPNKTQAFRQLAANLGFNLQELVPSVAAPSQAAQPPEVPAEIRPVLDQYGQVIGQYGQMIEQLTNRLQSYETNAQAQQQQAADQMIGNWAKDKPHFEAVRQRMGEFVHSDISRIQAGQPGIGYVENGNINLNKAYEDAVWAHPELRKQFQQEERAKREQERIQRSSKEVKTAKKAAVSIKPAAPTPPPAPPKRIPGKPESVAETIRRTMQEMGVSR